VQLHRARKDFDAAGVRLAVIGQGTPAHARDFQRTQDVEGLELYIDANRDSYRAAGAKVATVSELVGPARLVKGFRAMVGERVHQGGFAGGHPAQLGGVVIVTPDGAIPYVHLAEDASDNAPVAEVLAAARAATSRGG